MSIPVIEGDVTEEHVSVMERLDELVRSGGYPYIKITLVEPENGAVQIDTVGLQEDVDLALAFEQLAELIRGGAMTEVEA